MRSDPAIVQCIRGVRLVSKSKIISKAVMMINVVAARRAVCIPQFWPHE